MYNTPKNQYGIIETNIQLTDLEFSSMLTLVAAIEPDYLKELEVIVE